MLRNFIDKIKPNFEKGGRFSFLSSTFEAFETFLYVPNTVTRKGAHIRDRLDLKRVMIVVVIALLPCFLFGTYNVGRMHYDASFAAESQDFWACFLYGLGKTFPMLVVSYVVGLSIEFIFAQVKNEAVNEGFLVSGFLIPLICPPDLPLWMLGVATAFAVIIGKEVFGGTGMNIWNPALLARVFLFFAYPSQISGDSVWVADATSGPTALSALSQGNLSAVPSSDVLFWGLYPGCVGETSVFCILLGAVILLWTGIASWRIMLSILASGFVAAYLLNLGGFAEAGALEQVMMGGFMFGAVFMATDPVTASQTNAGKYVYGVLIGVLCMIIRAFNPAYPEGMMLAILFMNTFAPLIDYIFVQRNIKRRNKILAAKKI